MTATAFRRLAFLALAAAALLAPPAAAQVGAAQVGAAQAEAARERILSFASDITVQPGGALRVVETIEVVATGDQIRRGIYRDFPTRGITGSGFNDVVGFEVVRVERDGRPEPWFTVGLDFGVRVYAGDPDLVLEPKRYRYTFVYDTTRQLLHRPGEDELYWNVTGHHWAFPIDRATATVRLPPGAVATARAAYTGRPDWNGADFELLEDGGTVLRWATTRPLAPGEGFTIAVAWPEGAVARPGPGDDRLAFMAANRGILVGIVLNIVLVGYFAVTWHRVGRDPPKGTIVPLFDAPDGLSPVAVGFIWNRGFRGDFPASRALTVALTALAAKGVIAIEDEGDGEFVIERRRKPPGSLPPGEQAVAKALFAGGARTVAFGSEFDPRVAAAADALTNAFGGEYGRAYLRSNRDSWLFGAIIAAVAVASSLLGDAGGEDTLAMLAISAVIVIVFGAAALVMAGNALASLSGGYRYAPMGIVVSLVIATVCLLPVAGTLFLIAEVAAPAALVPGFLPVPVTIAFLHLLAAPTRLGRRTLDAIEGYRLYLSVAEADRLNVAGREPAVTEALFEAHLPYAMALGVESEWTVKVMERLSTVMRDPAQAGRSPQPGWYRMRGGGGIAADRLAGSLSSGLGMAAARASTRPSSSGGSGGGGSSGGGGGGGGGGGW